MRAEPTEPSGQPQSGTERGAPRLSAKRWERWARGLLLAYCAHHLGLLALARAGSWEEAERWALALRWPLWALLLTAYGPALWVASRGLSRRRPRRGRVVWAAALIFLFLHGACHASARWEAKVTAFDSLVQLHSAASSVDAFGVPWVALGLVCGASCLFFALSESVSHGESGRLARRAQFAACAVLIVLAALTVVSYATGG